MKWWTSLRQKLPYSIAVRMSLPLPYFESLTLDLNERTTPHIFTKITFRWYQGRPSFIVRHSLPTLQLRLHASRPRLCKKNSAWQTPLTLASRILIFPPFFGSIASYISQNALDYPVCLRLLLVGNISCRSLGISTIPLSARYPGFYSVGWSQRRQICLAFTGTSNVAKSVRYSFPSRGRLRTCSSYLIDVLPM